MHATCVPSIPANPPSSTEPASRAVKALILVTSACHRYEEHAACVTERERERGRDRERERERERCGVIELYNSS